MAAGSGLDRRPNGLMITRPLDSVRLLLTDNRYFWVLASLVILGDAFLTQFIIRYVLYTEIDFTTYMRQVDVYLAGERDYSLIKGPSGPLVYPAGHVLIHQVLHAITDGGARMYFAQQIYGILYLVSQFLTMTIYRMSGDVPNYAVMLLPLSKRLHSIYVLRMFNDCWAVVAVLGSIIALGRRKLYLASVLYSLALSVKMNILLYLPGLLVILVRREGFYRTISSLVIIFAVQVFVATPFLQHDPSAYLNNAFELSRVFLYKWTVNWRFVPEEVFLSKGFAISLLVGHLSVLVAFGLGRWCAKDGGAFAVIGRALRIPGRGAALGPVPPSEMFTILFTSNLIGTVFARSLHYQFYSWYAQQLPFLLFQTRTPLPLKLALLLAIEYAWNVFPSTSVSSAVLLLSNTAILLGLFFIPSEKASPLVQANVPSQEKERME